MPQLIFESLETSSTTLTTKLQTVKKSGNKSSKEPKISHASSIHRSRAWRTFLEAATGGETLVTWKPSSATHESQQPDYRSTKVFKSIVSLLFRALIRSTKIPVIQKLSLFHYTPLAVPLYVRIGTSAFTHTSLPLWHLLLWSALP